MIGTNGVLYGTTEYGGIDNRGTVFSLTPVSLPGHSWAFATLYGFQNLFSDGNYPVSGVVIGDGGVLYGTTFAGGTASLGVVFSLTPATPPDGRWTEAVLYSFMDVHPTRITLGAGGLLYGPAVHQRNKGSFLFSLTTTSSGWEEAPLYESQFKLGALAFDKSGVLAGTTGSQGETAGTVFLLEPPVDPGGSWTEVLLHTFDGNDGANPDGVVIGSGKVLYGTTDTGGTSNLGTVFALTL